MWVFGWFGRVGRLSLAIATATSILGLIVVATGPASANATTATTATVVAGGCQLGNGVSHVIEITFDNVHFFRDDPNVPSDLELMPHLLNFIEQNGTMLSNNHTPLIAHTANDSLTNYTGLYGDRAGMPVSNSYQAYNADGTTDPAGSFAYWTDPVFDTESSPNAGHDTNPSMVYSAVPPATASPAPVPNTTTPAPWVPFTRAGCNVGDVSTANMVLENTAVDIPKVFGAASPENANCTKACVSINSGFAYNHGDYAAEINTTWLGLVGPGVANNGVDGLGPNQGPSSAGPNSGNVTALVRGVIPSSGTTGTWVDHTDIRPTLLSLVGLKDDYIGDGRVITEDMTSPPAMLTSPAVQALSQVYKQLNASVGAFGTATLVAATHALASQGPGDARFKVLETQLSGLALRRDLVATTIKSELNGAEFNDTPIPLGAALSGTVQAQTLISMAERLAAS